VKGTKTQTSKRERIKESRCNREYQRCMIEEILDYLRRESAKEETGIGRMERKGCRMC
jgi:hypothetical protein